MLKTTGTSSKKDNIPTSNFYSVLNEEEDEEEDVENVYDETVNLFTKTGGSSSFTAAVEEPERTFNHRLRRRNRRVPFEQRDERPKNPREVYPPILDINYFHHFLNFFEIHNPMDDEPMSAADHVVAPIPGPTITIPETANEIAIKGNHLTLIKGNQFDGRIKTDPHKHVHKFLSVCDMFKYGETENKAVRLMMFSLSLTGEAKTWLDKLNQGTIKFWDELRTTFIRRFFPPALFDRLLGENRAFSQHNHETLTDAWLQTFMELKNKLETTTKNHQTSIQNLEAKFDRLADKQSARPSGSLPSNTQPNPRGNSSKPSTPTQARNEHVNAVFTRSGRSYDPPINPNNPENQKDFQNPVNFNSDDENEESTPTPQPKAPKPTTEIPTPIPYKPRIPYPQRLRKEIMEAQYEKFLDMIRAVRINVPLVDVLEGMQNYGKFLKELVSNKHKLEQISSAFLSYESSTIIQNKVPPKLGDPKSFLIPCTFSKTFSCNVLADLGASINLMPYSLYAKLSLKTFQPTKMSVRLTDRSFQYPIGIAENMLVEVGKFTFPIDFVILKMEEDNKVPLILGIPFLHIADAKYLDEPPTDLKLKPLSDHLEYAFLEEPSFLPVIISSQLSEQNKKKLISVLKRHKQAFAWKTKDIPVFSIDITNKIACMEFLIKNEEEIFTVRGDGVRIKPNGVASPAMRRLYLTRRSLKVLRKFHWTTLGGRSKQLSHVSSLLLSKPGEY
ncbi:reverse transcriptase domain-containing protein [Tanacetum coccineum]